MNEFDLTPAEERVTISGKEYVVREATAQAVIDYKNATFGAVRLSPEGKPAALEGLGGIDLGLLASCLFEVSHTKDGSTVEKPVALGVIRRWPNRVTEPLVKLVKRISELEDETLEALKKQREELDERIKRLEQVKNG